MSDEYYKLSGDEDVEFLPLMTLDGEEDNSSIKTYADELPIMPLKNTVLFPGVIIPITVNREKSLKSVTQANKNKDKILGVLSQIDPTVEEPTAKDLSAVGTLARIVKLLKMPDGTTTVIIQGKERMKVNEFVHSDPFFSATVDVLKDEKQSNKKEFEALVQTLKDMSMKIVKLSPNMPPEAELILKNIDSASFLIHFVASNLSVELTDKQKILELDNLYMRANLTLEHLSEQLQMIQLKDQIQSKVKTDIEKQQRDYFLHQQLKTIQEELGGDPVDKEIQELVLRSKSKKWSKTIAETFDKEIGKIRRVNPAAAEYSVVMNYLELLLDLPWEDYSKDNFDLHHALKVLDKDHYGLEKIKDRILEYLSVLKLKGDMKSPILCFVGPPGVGKTSLGRSIARALKRKYIRMSLGGLHDESEIRGHRKTYIGAMPGRIIQSLKKAKTSNPVFILDEIDKVGKDFRGDPSSALLEVLDPEQNSTFYDNYLELEYDLSKVMFIATANNLNTIQPALRDRMEIIRLNGYSLEEKTAIASKHLVPKQRKAHGVKSDQIKLSKKVLAKMIDEYTRESGVRNLDRQIASMMRWVAKNIAMEKDFNPAIELDDVEEILGKAKFDKDLYHQSNPAGVSIGLAWTVNGGDILFIESSLSKGNGRLTLTGSLGNVMKESASTALTYLKSHSEDYLIKPVQFSNYDVHVHIPEGGIPKDGPSAGITILTALTSAFTNRKVKPYLAMTGEITLRGKVLPVGGIKEKVLAAKRAGVKQIILCYKNEKDISEINPAFIKGLDFKYVKEMSEVLDLALEPAEKEDNSGRIGF